LILEVRVVVVDIGGESGYLQYQQKAPLTSNINNNPLSPSISTKAYSHFQYQQQPLSLPVSTTTSSHIQYQEQPTR
jgi:hypothetical protein